MNSGIYGIQNTVNNKWYIGQSVSISKRKLYHFWSLKTGRHYNDYFQNSFKKHGRDAFSFFILEYVKQSQLDEREVYWIQTMNSLIPNGYNLDSGGHNNHHHSLETRQKIRFSNLGITKPGHVITEEARRKISLANKGRRHTPETRNKMSASGKLKKLSAAHCAKIAESGKWSEERKTKQLKQIRALALNNLIKINSRPISIETKAKMSATHLGCKWTEVQKIARRNYLATKTLSK